LESFPAVVEQALEAMIFADREGIIRIWNAQAEVVFGFAASEAIGRSIDLIIPEDLRAAHWRGYHQAITTGQTKSDGRAMATRAAHKHAGKLYVELAFWIVSVSPHGVLGALATAKDITQSYLASRAKRSP
jgi:PAS domain S-box-containing protein